MEKAPVTHNYLGMSPRQQCDNDGHSSTAQLPRHYINTIGCDITKFNVYIQNLLEGLASRGETTNNLRSNLFKGYQAVSDHTFVKYINRKQEEYDDGLLLTRFQIMDLADMK